MLHGTIAEEQRGFRILLENGDSFAVAAVDIPASARKAGAHVHLSVLSEFVKEENNDRAIALLNHLLGAS